MDDAIEKLRYPIGKFLELEPTFERRTHWIEALESAPRHINTLARGLTSVQLKKLPYREGSWTAAQVIHHLADSHIHAYIRTSFCLTESDFTVTPYDENRWAQFASATNPDVTPSLELLGGLHTRWVELLRSLPVEAFSRPMFHPERGPMTLDSLIQYYAWHGQHHAAHLEIVKRLG